MQITSTNLALNHARLLPTSTASFSFHPNLKVIYLVKNSMPRQLGNRKFIIQRKGNDMNIAKLIL